MSPILGRTVWRVNHLEGALVFAGIPLAVVGAVIGAVFATSERPVRDQPRTGDPKAVKPGQDEPA
jgi:hypothetical protein